MCQAPPVSDRESAAEWARRGREGQSSQRRWTAQLWLRQRQQWPLEWLQFFHCDALQKLWR